MEFPFIKAILLTIPKWLWGVKFFNMMLYNLSSQGMCTFCPSHYILFFNTRKGQSLASSSNIHARMMSYIWLQFPTHMFSLCVCVCICVCFLRHRSGRTDQVVEILLFVLFNIISMSYLWRRAFFWNHHLCAHFEWGRIWPQQTSTHQKHGVGWMICEKKTFFSLYSCPVGFNHTS